MPWEEPSLVLKPVRLRARFSANIIVDAANIAEDTLIRWWYFHWGPIYISWIEI